MRLRLSEAEESSGKSCMGPKIHFSWQNYLRQTNLLHMTSVKFICLFLSKFRIYIYYQWVAYGKAQ